VVFRPESFCKTDFSLLNPLECTEKDHHFHFPYNHFFVYVMMVRGYSLRPTKSVVIAFKFCPTKSVVLACNEIHLIKAIPSTKKALHRKAHRANQILSRYYFSSSNAYAFIEDPENQMNNTVFNHNW